jgi:succinoglycan biosynthesis protein ExoV
MKLFYYKDRSGNFGDDLNPLIWYSLYPELFTAKDNDETIVGIGTLINDRAPQSGKLHVLGSGVGYHGKAAINDRWNVVFVRGPQSAKAMGLDTTFAATDPAILISKIYKPAVSEALRNEVTFMPHHASTHFANWEEICAAAGITYLNPAADIHETIHKIRNSKLVLAEAMHAAIVADALRVPWIPIKAYPHILDFKWIDWCESMELPYEPVLLPTLWDTQQFHSKKDIMKSKIKRSLLLMGATGKRWTPPLPENNKKTHLPGVLRQLKILSPSNSFLSRDTTHEKRAKEIHERIGEFINTQNY